MFHKNAPLHINAAWCLSHKKTPLTKEGRGHHKKLELALSALYRYVSQASTNQHHLFCKVFVKYVGQYP